jgi:hypothetical protein
MALAAMLVCRSKVLVVDLATSSLTITAVSVDP